MMLSSVNNKMGQQVKMTCKQNSLGYVCYETNEEMYQDLSSNQVAQIFFW